MGSGNGTPKIEFNANEFPLHMDIVNAKDNDDVMVKLTYKSRRVLIANGLGIAKCFQYRIGLQYLLFQMANFFTTRDGRQVLYNSFGALSFTCTRLTPA
jgi:hypothetical protein